MKPLASYSRYRFLLASLLAITLPACSLFPGLWPSYQKPAIEVPAAWQEGWRPATPNDAQAKGPWWEIYGDAELNRLEQNAQAQNQTLKAGLARVQQARAMTTLSRAALFPTLDFSGRATRTQPSANRPNNSRNSSLSAKIQKDINPVFVAGYEVDLFGRIAKTIEGASANEQQAQADLENLRLILAADVATNYFSIRALDAEIEVVDQSADLQKRALALAKSRYQDGVAIELDVFQQEALLNSSLAQRDVLRRQREELSHALATLTGSTVNQFKLAAGKLPNLIPEVPIGLPADVLERRPDVAAAERDVAAANAQLGVAKTAWFPTLRLTATRGWQSTTTANLFDASSVVWSLGLTLAQTIFDGGRNNANIEFAKAGHELASANYRQTVLDALQEVEDGLSTGGALADAAANSRAAESASTKAANIVEYRYKGGLSSSLELITARKTLLDNRRQVQALQGQQLINSVLLIKSLGGSWQGETAGPEAKAASAK